MSRTNLARAILSAPPNTQFVVCVSGPGGIQVWCDGDGTRVDLERELRYWAGYLPTMYEKKAKTDG